MSVLYFCMDSMLIVLKLFIGVMLWSLLITLVAYIFEIVHLVIGRDLK